MSKEKKKTKIAYNLKQGVNSDHLKWEIVFYHLTLVQASVRFCWGHQSCKNIAVFLKVWTVFSKKKCQIYYLIA